jgi:DNA invertase Pin-like site-specific DNA recombinase
VFEEKISGKLNTDDRPALLEALSHIRDGDMLTVQEVDRLGRNLNYPALLWGLGQLREDGAGLDRDQGCR